MKFELILFKSRGSESGTSIVLTLTPFTFVGNCVSNKVTMVQILTFIGDKTASLSHSNDETKAK
jgi:hypothetical protein